MKKTITFLFLLLLIVLFISVVLFFRGAPQLTPAPLKPVLSWVDDTQDKVVEQWAQWQREVANAPAPVVASDSAASTAPLSQVTLGSNEVSTVRVDQDGSVAIVPPPSQAMAAAEPDQPLTASGIKPDQSDAKPLIAAQLTTSEQTSAELAAIAKADAAIAAADAALAKAQGKPVPLEVASPRPIEVPPAPRAQPVRQSVPAGTAVVGMAEDSRDQSPVRQSNSTGGSANALPAGGSALSGASIALSQASQPIKANEPVLLAAIPAPKIIPPDQPAPEPAASEAGREQQAIIKNFLAGEVVEFETGRDVLTPKGRRALQALVSIIQQNEDSVITIQGHTDSVGDERSNLELSTSRAIAARSYLVRRGVQADRLLVQGFGERKPISTNGTAAGRERNRRIDFAVSDR